MRSVIILLIKKITHTHGKKSVNKIYIVISFFVITLTGCASAPKQNTQWYTPKGVLSDQATVDRIKAECNFDENLSDAKRETALARSAVRRGDEDSAQTWKEADKHTHSARSLTRDAYNCMEMSGLILRGEGYVPVDPAATKKIKVQDLGEAF